MRILLYEFVRAGGWRSLGWTPPPESIRREGAAMLKAVAEDFSAIDGVEVIIVEDSPVGAFDAKQDTEANCATGGLPVSAALDGSVDWTLLIAPETGGALQTLSRDAELTGSRLLSPSSEFVRLTSDKHRTATRLTQAGVPAAWGLLLPAGTPLPRDFGYRAVLKPVDGAGSQQTFLVDRADAVCADASLPHNQLPRRLERFYPGTPVSVAVLCGPAGSVSLMPCRQRLSDDGRFRYLGGELPLADVRAARASELAMRGFGALPPARGYVGVDLVLGDDPSGRRDVVIEVNPRLTTSYVGLRAMCPQNLAQAMLDVAMGNAPELSWRDGVLQFGADGQIALAGEPLPATKNSCSI
jgi:hypothetical protein